MIEDVTECICKSEHDACSVLFGPPELFDRSQNVGKLAGIWPEPNAKRYSVHLCNPSMFPLPNRIQYLPVFIYYPENLLTAYAHHLRLFHINLHTAEVSGDLIQVIH